MTDLPFTPDEQAARFVNSEEEAEEFVANATLSASDLRRYLADVIVGKNPAAARALIGYFYWRIENYEDYDRDVLHEYLRHAFGRILGKGESKPKSADVAFGLKRGRGEYPRPDHLARDIAMAAHVHVLQTYKNFTWLDAVTETAGLFFDEGGEKAVEAAYRDFKGFVEHFTCDDLKDLVNTLRS